ncbi:pyridoxal phosphate-dependent transferase [Cercophora newfieldiana]|uniref:Pyridoxal phosphate-dependent transferase n=1 Tax=Cercophora newfieldiana TaxID=92897 RepID=A0AA39Y9Y7_9PEZI|nr:pyridoxal phosphate-dependent transferase [Cercophora newfieldiana]
MSVIEAPERLPLGESLPPGDLHAVSVALPKWADTAGWASREPRVIKAMTVGYPRFMIARIIESLASRLLEEWESKTGISAAGRRAMILCSYRHAAMCREFLHRQTPPAFHSDKIIVFSVSWNGLLAPIDQDPQLNGNTERSSGQEDIFVVSYPEELYLEAKAFWQHTGFGVSSRRVTHWAEHGPFPIGPATKDSAGHVTRFDAEAGSVSRAVGTAKDDIRKLIAANQLASGNISVHEDDVLLYPCGMAGITEVCAAVQVLRGADRMTPCAAVVFGFLYVDTYKVVTRVLGYDATLYKFDDSEIDILEARLRSGARLDLLLTEFPGNPLLQSPNLDRLSTLSRKYNFVLVVDDTIGSCANVNVLSACDVVCTSLTKMFSGTSNVMGGSVVLSPNSPFHHALRHTLLANYGDNKWFPDDVLLMESNSRNFVSRTRQASANASAVAKQLRAHPSVTEVYYPEGSPSQRIYENYKLPDGGYGFMLSIRFTSAEKAIAFHDALDVAKGPSLGTNFTLACPYTLLAHFKELEWAAEYGVVEDLVRISVGLEDEKWLETRIERALQAAGEQQ